MVSIPIGLLEETMNLLRKDAQSLPDREEHYGILFRLYIASDFYPSGPLRDFEIIEVQEISWPYYIYEGMFLGKQKVAVTFAQERTRNVWRPLKHPNILPLIGSITHGPLFETNSKVVMISPWMHNGVLSEYLERYVGADYLFVLSQIAAGLEYLHTLDPPVIHGNLQGSNILISYTGVPCIAGFGTARLASSVHLDDRSPTPYDTQSQTGSLWWSAPEILMGASPTLESDIFAFGRIVLEMFLRDAFFQETDQKAMANILNGTLPKGAYDINVVARGFGDHMRKLVEHCSLHDPKQRPTAQEIAHWLSLANGSPQREFWYPDFAIEPHGDIEMIPSHFEPLPLQAQQRFLAQMSKLREGMLHSMPSERDKNIERLSEMYSFVKIYPADVLDECEISKQKVQPSDIGGFGACWEGIFLGRHKVALKCSHSYILDEAAAKQAEREIKAWKGLQHPNILPFIGSVTLDPECRTYLVSPWMENGDALRFVKKNTNADRIKLLLQITEGLKYLHSHDPVVVHGDIKATNIFISDTGQACIGDFGLSQRLIEGATGTYSTAWFIAGNPRWQAPELLVGEDGEVLARRTPRSDVFAFGRVMLELFTGDVPFCGNSDLINITLLVINGDNPSRPTAEEVALRGLDDEMWCLIEACWQKDALARPSALQIAERLQAMVETRSSSTARGKTVSNPRVVKGGAQKARKKETSGATGSGGQRRQRGTLLSKSGGSESQGDFDTEGTVKSEYDDEETERTAKRRRRGDEGNEERDVCMEERKRRRTKERCAPP